MKINYAKLDYMVYLVIKLINHLGNLLKFKIVSLNIDKLKMLCLPLTKGFEVSSISEFLTRLMWLLLFGSSEGFLFLVFRFADSMRLLPFFSPDFFSGKRLLISGNSEKNLLFCSQFFLYFIRNRIRC